MYLKHRFMLYPAVAALLISAQPTFADTSESRDGDPGSGESTPPESAPGNEHAGGDNSQSEKNSDWQACWQRFLDAYQGSRDRRDEWYYDGTCRY